MYVSNNKENNNKFLKYLQFNVANKDKKVASLSWRYFKISNYLLDLNTYLRTVTNEEIEVATGNVLSELVIVVDTMSNKKVLNFLRDLFKILKLEYHNAYFTSLNKSSNNVLNADVLNREISAIAPKVVIGLDNSTIAINSNSNMTIYHLPYKEMNKMLDLMDRADELSEIEAAELTVIKNKMWSILKNIIQGYSTLQ